MTTWWSRGCSRGPGADLGAVRAGEIVGENEDVARRVVGFDGSSQRDGVRRVARGGTPGHTKLCSHMQHGYAGSR
jgi:hypothetical protein